MNAFKKVVTTAVVASSLTATVGALAATNDLFLKLDGIKGESADSKHKGEIDILSWSWGVAMPVNTATGQAAGKVQYHDLNITKHIDAASPSLLAMSSSGTHIKTVNLVVRKAGGKQTEFLKIKLEDVLISSVVSSVKADDTIENITLSFGKIEYEYTLMGPDGSPTGTPVRYGWDLKANIKA